MTEKQRWLIRELETWHNSERKRIGQYGPKTDAKAPPDIVRARREIKRLQKRVDKWNVIKTQPWERLRKTLQDRHDEVRRVILFERTEVALKALRALNAPKRRRRG